MAWGSIFDGTKRSERFDIASDSETLTIRVLAIGTRIRKVTVIVTAAFDGTKALSIGFPADHSAILATTQIDLTTIGVYAANIYRTSTIQETLRAFFTGTATTGAGQVIVEFF